MFTSGLVERETELALIAETFGVAAAGHGCLLILEGEAGIGKTVLLARAREHASRLGFRTFTARAGSFERSVGFGMARELFESSVARASSAERRALLSGSARLAAPLLGIEQGDPEARSAVAGTGTSEHGFDHGLYWLVANLADAGPVTLLIDDAHWCDEPTLHWLLYLLRRAEALAVAIVLAVRKGEAGAPTGLLDALAVEPATVSARLRPLGPRGTTALLENAYGTSVDEQFSAACHEWTAGNPMFISALAAELVAEGVAPIEESVAGMRRLTPPSIARVTLLRLARLPEDAVELGRAIAVLGASGDLAMAARLAGLSEQGATEASDVLTAARVLEPSHPPRFTHPLVASVVYEDMAPARRAADHKRAARLLSDAGAPPERVVTQLLRCAPAGEPWVADALLAGAQRELERASARTAISLLRRAVQEPPAGHARATVLRTLGLAESLAGDPAAAGSLQAALEATSDPHERGLTALLLGRLLVRAGRNREALDALEAASDRLDAGDVDLRLQLEAALLTAARLDVRLAEVGIKRVAALAPDLHTDTHGGRLIAAQLSWGATAIGKSLDASVGLARQALAGGALIAEAPGTPDAYMLPILMLSLCDELDEADGYCEQAITLARETGSEPGYAGTACLQSGVAYQRGRLAQAEVLARDALRLAHSSSELALVNGLARAYLANVLVERDQVSAALELLGDSALLMRSPHAWAAELLYAAGRAHVADQRGPEGLELLLACGSRCLGYHVKNPAWLSWRSEAALALQRTGDLSRARELADEELWRARRFGANRPLGVALRAVGLIEGGDAGLELLRESAEVLRSSPARLERARSLVALGGALRRAGSRADARRPLTEGLDLADDCDAVVLSALAGGELRACGARPRAVMRSGAEALTPSERRVCEMAAAGMSNPEIAQALFVTRATVESHLHSAYRKLDVPGRKELAAAIQAA